MKVYKIEINDENIGNYTFYIDEEKENQPYGLLDDNGMLVGLGNISNLTIKEILAKLIKLDSVENIWEFVDGNYIKKYLW